MIVIYTQRGKRQKVSLAPNLALSDAPTRLRLAGFVAGDTVGEARRAVAVQDANEQGPLQPAGSTRQKLYDLQASLAQLPDIEFPLQHVFAPGVYARTIILPAGSVIVGKIHKHAHVNILSMGTVDVITESGGVERLSGPLTMVSPPGTKRAVYAHTDSVWTTIHPTNETDLDKIEDEVIAKTYSEYERFHDVHVARSDYLKVLEETGKSHKWVRSVSENPEDQTDFPEGYAHLVIKPSGIEGMGLFTEKAIKSGEVIGPARIAGKRTPLGRYANHSPRKNTEFLLLTNGDLDSIATEDIPVGAEILNDYRQGAQLSGITLNDSSRTIKKGIV